MRHFLVLSLMLLSFSLSLAQTFDKALAGMYEATQGSDWIRLNPDGTGRLCIHNDALGFGCKTFTWHSSEDKIGFTFRDQAGNEFHRWAVWIRKNGIVQLEFPTFYLPLYFIKTR